MKVWYELKAIRLTFYIALLSLSACSSCYQVRVKVDNTSGISSARAHFNQSVIRDISPWETLCETVPKSVKVSYFTRDAHGNSSVEKYALNSVLVAGNLPTGFFNNPARQIVFHLNANGRAEVQYRMRLSELTTKYVRHTETELEKKQRLLDEELWVAIESKNAYKVSSALSRGASVNQPWMNSLYGEVSDDKLESTIFEAAMISRDPEVIEAVLRAGAVFEKEGRSTPLWFSFPDSSTVDAGYVGNQLASILLKYGANPNAGLPIRFDWASTDWRRHPGMPKYADLKKPPVDRLIYLAVKMNNSELVKMLLNAGATVDFQLPKNREPPEWWLDGELFMTWVNREGSENIRGLLN